MIYPLGHTNTKRRENQGINMKTIGTVIEEPFKRVMLDDMLIE